MYLFVYGSLKRGFENYHYLKSARFLGEALTKERYAMYPEIAMDYPYLVKEALFHVQGEVYEIDSACLKELDILENIPEDYERELIEVEISSGIVVAHTYFRSDTSSDLLNMDVAFQNWELPRKDS